MPIALLEDFGLGRNIIHVLKKQKYGTAVLNVGRSKEGRDSKKVFVMMYGIYRREAKESATAYPVSIGAVWKVWVDSG
ncbi:MAG: hypothetical protein Q8K46_03970 [Deltaproteobacteria bacterium]|nr:hypothetical protein [Deltaproteobacteria bacterium]